MLHFIRQLYFSELELPRVQFCFKISFSKETYITNSKITPHNNTTLFPLKMTGQQKVFAKSSFTRISVSGQVIKRIALPKFANLNHVINPQKSTIVLCDEKQLSRRNYAKRNWQFMAVLQLQIPN